MVLRDDRRGIVSLADAMIFVTVISIASLALFSFCISEYQMEPMAKTVCEDVVSIELKASDVLNTNDSDVYAISDLLASGMNSNQTEKLEKYLKDTLDDLIPKRCGYSMTISYDDRTMGFARQSDMPVSSEYSTDVGIINGTTMSYSLTIFSD